ncbi:MAG: 3-phosphoglycerate dehydrogenase [Caldimonas sp.]
MADPVGTLVLDLLDWIGRERRPYAEVIDAWRTSCPKLPVWEEANVRGFVGRRHEAGGEEQVFVTPAGFAQLESRRRVAAAAPHAPAAPEVRR